MPKPITRRRIDGRPQRAIRRFQAGSGTSGGGTTTPTPTAEISVVQTFSGGGDPGQIDTFPVTGGLQNGDIYLVAYAFDGNGSLSFSPYDVFGGSNSFGVSSTGYLVGVAAWEVGASGHGATSFTVTTNTEASAFHGWLLRGARTSLDTADTIGDIAYFDVTRPGGCGSPLDPVITHWEPMPAIVAPAEVGAFGIYACGGRANFCSGTLPILTVTGGTSVVHDSHLVAPLVYEFGTVIAPWEIDADISDGEHGNLCSAAIIVVYPAE
jgi:hypothetical protein